MLDAKSQSIMVVSSLSHLLSLLLFLGSVLGIFAAPLTIEASTVGLQRRQSDQVVKFMIAKGTKPVEIDMNVDQPWDTTVELGFQIGDGTPYYASRDGQSVASIDAGPKGPGLDIGTVKLDKEGTNKFWTEIAGMQYSSKLCFFEAVTRELEKHEFMQNLLQQKNWRLINQHINEVKLFAF
ncbi:hypothetical protein DFJ43DRAFT_1148693 [Lentinula guzmanii]|uniref:Uncharacterized protein n=1 Tax=Lentinula guzmanii TaxID=2804957 RepID=A0AA38JXS6_9AGAR|nr:hypothetical protein DFJ43DRAFT_1148693 [Lentinula guzmanii]